MPPVGAYVRAFKVMSERVTIPSKEFWQSWASKRRGARCFGEFSVSAGQQMPFVLSYGQSHIALPEPVDPAAALRATSGEPLAPKLDRCAKHDPVRTRNGQQLAGVALGHPRYRVTVTEANDQLRAHRHGAALAHHKADQM
jgi:hypothetical protein